MTLSRKQFLGTLGGVAAYMAAPKAFSQSPITLRLHHPLPPQAPIPRHALTAWADKVKKDSDGRIRVQLFPAMQLGGRPQDLVDQARNGVVDLVWTILGYTPGRFPKTEVFELPFMVGKATESAVALQQYVEQQAMDEFKGVKLITVHTHGPGLFHGRKPIKRLEDMQGMKVRGGSRIINIALKELGAVAVGMPVPQTSEALSKGVIDATTLPWEVVPAYRVQQTVKNHTGFAGPKGLYTQTFGVMMNQKRYDALPDDLKAVIDANSGVEVARAFGAVMDEYDQIGLQAAEKARNNIVMLDDKETARWQAALAPTRDAWFQEVQGKGIDGPKLLAEAERLIAAQRSES